MGYGLCETGSEPPISFCILVRSVVPLLVSSCANCDLNVSSNWLSDFLTSPREYVIRDRECLFSTLFISSWKYAGAFANPKGTFRNLCFPKGDVKNIWYLVDLRVVWKCQAECVHLSSFVWWDYWWKFMAYGHLMALYDLCTVLCYMWHVCLYNWQQVHVNLICLRCYKFHQWHGCLDQVSYWCVDYWWNIPLGPLNCVLWWWLE